MARANPLANDAPTDAEDQALVARARSGDREALEALVGRHQPWIYNIAVRMLYHPQDAEDATQEILVKALTGLASFEGRSSFRTWLYRIVVNHVLNTKRGRREPHGLTFGCYGHGLDATPDFDPPDDRAVPVDVRLLVAEARITCTSWVTSSRSVSWSAPSSWTSAVKTSGSASLEPGGTCTAS